MMTAREKGLLLVGISAVIFGLQSNFAQLCYQQGFSVTFLVFCRFAIASVLLLIYAVLTKQPIALPKKQLKIGLLLGFLTAGATGAVFKAFELLPAAIAIICFYIYPSLTSILSRIFYHVPFTKIRVMAILTCFLGIFLLYWGSYDFNYDLMGALFAVLAAVFMSFLIIFLGKYMPEVNKISYTLTVYYVSALIFLVWNLLNQGLFAVEQVRPLGILYVLLLVLLPTIAANLLMSFGMATAPAVDASILNTLEVPFAAIFAFLIFGDRLIGWQITGALLIIAAAVAPAIAEKYIKKKLLKKTACENESVSSLGE